MASTDFKTLRNLAFYDRPNPEYFYFESLHSFRYKTKKMAAYDAKANEVEEEAKSILDTLPSFAETDDKLAVENINRLIEFLEKAVIKERENEMAFFKNKIAQLKPLKETRASG